MWKLFIFIGIIFIGVLILRWTTLGERWSHIGAYIGGSTSLGAVMSQSSSDHSIKTGASESIICDKTNQLMDKFLTERFTHELAKEMNDTANDITYDVATPAAKKDSVSAKIALDGMLHYYINNKRPNSASVAAMRRASDYLKEHPGCFTKEKVAKLISTFKPDLAAKHPNRSLDELFRDYSLAEDCQDEISRKNIELSTVNAELKRVKADLSSTSARSLPSISALSSELYLDECNRDKRALQDQIYSLRKDIERLRNSPSPSIDNSVVSDLRARYDSVSSQLAQCNAQRAECQLVLDQVLNAAG